MKLSSAFLSFLVNGTTKGMQKLETLIFRRESEETFLTLNKLRRYQKKRKVKT